MVSAAIGDATKILQSGESHKNSTQTHTHTHKSAFPLLERQKVNGGNAKFASIGRMRRMDRTQAGETP